MEEILTMLGMGSLALLRGGKGRKLALSLPPKPSAKRLEGYGETVGRHDLAEVEIHSDDRVVTRELVWILDVWSVSGGTGYVFSYFVEGERVLPEAPLRFALANGDKHSVTGKPWTRYFKSVVPSPAQLDELQWRVAVLADPGVAATNVLTNYNAGRLPESVALARCTDVIRALVHRQREEIHIDASARWVLRLYSPDYSSHTSIDIEGSLLHATRKFSDVSSVCQAPCELLSSDGICVAFSPGSKYGFYHLAVEEGERERLYVSLVNEAGDVREKVLAIVCPPEVRQECGRLLARYLPPRFAIEVASLLRDGEFEPPHDD